ncbi:MAG: hypothetical protein QOH61_1910, partial [Chloroflexota bacterium]|nr:hypothetical protein [Chloroflexota bacterium]
MNLGPRPVRVATRQPHGGGPARAVATIALIAALLGLAGCSTVSQRITRVEHRSLDVPIGAHTDLSVVTFNGHVNVTAIGEGTADVSVTAFGRGLNKADAQTAADAVTVSIDEQPGALIVSAQPRPGTPAGATNGADVDVVLPPNSSLKLVSSNGRVEAINVRGSVVVSTSNGEVVTRGGKDILVETTNGTITMSGPAGSIRA